VDAAELTPMTPISVEEVEALKKLGLTAPGLYGNFKPACAQISNQESAEEDERKKSVQ
jgi:hypothetical protein